MSDPEPMLLVCYHGYLPKTWESLVQGLGGSQAARIGHRGLQVEMMEELPLSLPRPFPCFSLISGPLVCRPAIYIKKTIYYRWLPTSSDMG